MKKLTAATILIFLSLLFSSCGPASYYQNAVSVLEGPYRACVRISDGGEIYEAKIVKDSDGIITIEFLEPSLLCGISYGFDGEECRLSYGGVSLQLDGGAKDKVSGGVYVWYGMLSPDKASVTGRKVKNADKIYNVLTDGQNEYTLDAKTGAPVLITRGDTAISFTEFTQNAELPEGTGRDQQTGP